MADVIQTETLFEVKNIGKTFRNGSKIRYDGDMLIKKGSFTFLTGDSGVGKSTLLHILGLIDFAEEIDADSKLTYFPYRNGNPVNYFDLFARKWLIFNSSNARALIRRQDFGFLPQDGHLLNTFSIQENLDIVQRSRRQPAQKMNSEEEAQATLKAVGFADDEHIWDRRKFSPLNLSGGQRQRLALARAIICNGQSRVIFVDEPTTYMDKKLVELTFNLLVDMVLIHRCTVIIVTHEYDSLRAYLEDNLAKRSEAHSIENTYSLQLDSIQERTSLVKIIPGF